MPNPVKIKRLESQIQRRVAMLMIRDMRDPRIRSVTITRVKLSGDLSACTVLWSTLEEDGKRRAVERALDGARGWVQREVAEILETRVTPVLRFEFDPSLEGADRVFRLLRDAGVESTPPLASDNGTESPAAEDSVPASPDDPAPSDEVDGSSAN